MEFDERLGWLLLGCAIGFIMGYIVRSLHDIKEELHKVDNHVTHRDERGIMRFPLAANTALVIVVCITAYAAFKSQKASNDVKDTQDDLAHVALCNQQYLKAQAEFLQVYLKAPRGQEAAIKAAVQNYLKLLTAFDKDNDKVLSHTKPLTDCIGSTTKEIPSD